jgi:hypothetical protein
MFNPTADSCLFCNDVSIAYPTVTCRTELVGSAARCFIVEGGFTILGDGDISWAGPLALVLTQEAMDGGRLNNVNPDVVDVRFLEAFNSTITFNNDTLVISTNNTVNSTDGGDGNGNQTGSGIVTIGSKDNDVPGWSWALVSIGIVAFFVAVAYLVRRLASDKRGNNETGHFDPDEATDLRSGMEAPIDADEGETASWMDVATSEGESKYSDPLLPPAASRPRGVV